MYAAPIWTKLPASVDLRANLPEVYNQGRLGSCTGNAIAGAVHFLRLKDPLLPDWSPSRLLVYYMERAAEGTIESDAGAQIRDGIRCVSKQGTAPEDLWPYDIAKFADKPPDTVFAEAAKHPAVQYYRVYQFLHSLKTCLAEGYPFVFGFTVYDSFETDEVAKTGKVPLPQKGESRLGGHAVLCCGYDNDAHTFLVRNSWGADWGDRGYCHMPYEMLESSSLSRDFWTVRMTR